MYQVIEKDWKLFRELLPEWQEAYMERLVKKYIELLSSDRQASDKFWKLDKRIKQDKRRTGVLARDVKRSNMFQLGSDFQGRPNRIQRIFAGHRKNKVGNRPEIF